MRGTDKKRGKRTFGDFGLCEGERGRKEKRWRVYFFCVLLQKESPISLMLQKGIVWLVQNVVTSSLWTPTSVDGDSIIRQQTDFTVHIEKMLNAQVKGLTSTLSKEDRHGVIKEMENIFFLLSMNGIWTTLVSSRIDLLTLPAKILEMLQWGRGREPADTDNTSAQCECLEEEAVLDPIRDSSVSCSLLVKDFDAALAGLDIQNVLQTVFFNSTLPLLAYLLKRDIRSDVLRYDNKSKNFFVNGKQWFLNALLSNVNTRTLKEEITLSKTEKDVDVQWTQDKLQVRLRHTTVPTQSNDCQHVQIFGKGDVHQSVQLVLVKTQAGVVYAKRVHEQYAKNVFILGCTLKDDVLRLENDACVWFDGNGKPRKYNSSSKMKVILTQAVSLKKRLLTRASYTQAVRCTPWKGYVTELAKVIDPLLLGVVLNAELNPLFPSLSSWTMRLQDNKPVMCNAAPGACLYPPSMYCGEAFCLEVQPLHARFEERARMDCKYVLAQKALHVAAEFTHLAAMEKTWGWGSLLNWRQTKHCDRVVEEACKLAGGTSRRIGDLKARLEEAKKEANRALDVAKKTSDESALKVMLVQSKILLRVMEVEKWMTTGNAHGLVRSIKGGDSDFQFDSQNGADAKHLHLYLLPSAHTLYCYSTSATNPLAPDDLAKRVREKWGYASMPKGVKEALRTLECKVKQSPPHEVSCLHEHEVHVTLKANNNTEYTLNEHSAYVAEKTYLVFSQLKLFDRHPKAFADAIQLRHGGGAQS